MVGHLLYPSYMEPLNPPFSYSFSPQILLLEVPCSSIHQPCQIHRPGQVDTGTAYGSRWMYAFPYFLDPILTLRIRHGEIAVWEARHKGAHTSALFSSIYGLSTHGKSFIISHILQVNCQQYIFVVVVSTSYTCVRYSFR